jgi:hypothetical protein
MMLTMFMRNHIMLVSMIVIPIIIGVPFYVYGIGPSLNQGHQYAVDTLKGLQTQKQYCWALQFMVNSDIGKGVWSLDSVEKQVGELAIQKLNDGDCTK